MLRGSRPVGVRLAAAVVAAERAGRVGQRPRHCRWTWLTCAVDLDRTGPDVSRQKGQCIYMPGPDHGEVTAVQCRHIGQPESLGYRDNRGVGGS
jgi:hypothetical protein